MSLSEGSTSNGPNDFVIVSSNDLPMNHYQIRDGELHFRIIREYTPGEWRKLTLTDVLMHLVWKTDVADWLYARRGDRREPLVKEHA